MKKNLTELVFILDRSGSMGGLEDDIIGGFNTMIEKQRNEPGEAYVSTVLFSDDSRVIHDRVALSRIQPLTRKDYEVMGCTALMDAVGSAMRHIGYAHKYARDEDRPEHTLFVIATDGMENASRRYNAQMIREKIRRQKEKYGWEFIFLGANIDSAATADRMGINRENAVDYHADSQGLSVTFEALEAAVCQVRAHAPLGQDDSWRHQVDADFLARQRKR